jgi:hypothetical protein
VAGAAAATGAVLQAAGRRGLLVRQEVSHTSFPATPMVCCFVSIWCALQGGQAVEKARTVEPQLGFFTQALERTCLQGGSYISKTHFMGLAVQTCIQYVSNVLAVYRMCRRSCALCQVCRAW